MHSQNGVLAVPVPGLVRSRKALPGPKYMDISHVWAQSWPKDCQSPCDSRRRAIVSIHTLTPRPWFD